MKRTALLGVAALTTIGLAVTGCGSSGDSSGTGGATGTGGSTTSNGGSSSTTNGTGGTTAATGGSTSTSAACGTTNGTYTETTSFATASKTSPYSLNAYGFGTNPTALTQTTSGPTGLDCSAGCAMATLTYGAGLAQYAAGAQFVEYFGTTATDVTNLLNETVTMKIAVTATAASGATSVPPVTINMFGQDTYTSTTGVDNIWNDDLGTTTALDAASGWHTVTYKVVDAHVPSWAPTRWICASTLHDLGIVIQNNAAITSTNAGTITLYVQSVTVAP